MHRYTGAISDADILIHLAMVDRLDILEYLFEKIIIPQYVYEVELRKKAGRYLTTINRAISKEGSIFHILDREKEPSVNYLAKDIIDEKFSIVGPGESECAGYAYALRIPIIISDNSTEFRYLDEFIMLTYYDILALCVHFKYIDKERAEEIYNAINNQLSHPSGDSFSDKYRKSMRRFRENGWTNYLLI